MLQVFQVFNKLSEIQVKLKTKCMKTYIEMEKLTPKRLWKFPQKRFGALVGPFSRFPGSVATLFFVGGGARGVQAFDPPPAPPRGHI